MNLQNIDNAKKKLAHYDPKSFTGIQNSFRFFTYRIEIGSFRHLENLNISFNHPVTVITGPNKIGKTSVLLLIACSHYNFLRYDSTKPETQLRRHTWRDVLPFTAYETSNRDYFYKLFWRVGNDERQGEGKRLRRSRAWTGLGKASSDPRRINAQIREREVRLIDLERVLPVRNFSNSLLRKTSSGTRERVSQDIEQAFSYIFDLPGNIEIYKAGSHVNKFTFLINYSDELYSSYNAASGEEALLNILQDIFDSPNDSLILIDEIEAGFHPYIQRKLADIIQYVSWTHKKQFIITTHSPTLMSSFPQKSRVYIDINIDGTYRAIEKISVNAAFSKMDSVSYPLLQLYCEDDLAKFIIKSMLIEINQEVKYFDRLINIICSGPVNQVKNDYNRHKRNYKQLKLKIGYACVFDGDYKDDPNYSSYFNNPNEFSFFLYPYMAPEKFLIQAYLRNHSNVPIQTALNYSDHHALFQEMVNQGLAPDQYTAIQLCWTEFKNGSEYNKLFSDFKNFIMSAAKYFSEINEE